jgi:acyl-CoA dehydrogenase
MYASGSLMLLPRALPMRHRRGGTAHGRDIIMTSVRDESPWMTDETRMFRRTVRQFIETELAPHHAHWEQQGYPDSEAWLKAGKIGLLLSDVPEEYGGGGGTFAHEAVVIEELARSGVHFGFNIQSIVAHYILAYGNEEQRKRWLPALAAGELVGAVGLTEPQSGSDLQGTRTTARRDGDQYVINGSKTFITNGWQAGLICLAVRTDPKAPGPRALSLIVIETKDLPGYRVGHPLHKIGRRAQDTCELFFDEMRVPAANLLGSSEGRGLLQMMDQFRYERLSIGLSAVAAAEHAIKITADYVKERKAFGKPLMDLQNTRFKLAECKTEAHIGRLFIDNCIEQFIAGQLDSLTAAMAKYWLTDCQCRVIDECVQLHGGYGYMQETPIARMWADARVQRIYGGANEVLKEMVASSL